MHIMRIFILSILLFATAMTCAAEGKKINSVIAIVNNQSITQLEMQRQEAEIRRQSVELDETLTDDEVRRQALDSLIFRLLQLQYARQTGLSIPETMVDERLNELQSRWEVSNKADFTRILKKQFDISLENFRIRMREEIQIEALFYREVFQKINVYEEEIDNFLRSESGMARQREYRLNHILIAADEEEEQPAARKEIEDLRQRIIGGESFTELARKYSAAEEAKDGGDLQWRATDQLPLPFIAAAQNLSEGEISPIISTPRGFHLLELTGARGGEVDEKNLSRLHISHLFLSPDDESLAKQLHQQLLSGDDFAELVKQYSVDDKSVQEDGKIGWFLPGDLPAYFFPAIQLGEGEYSEPVISPFGVHILRVDKREAVDMQAIREQARQILHERRAIVQRLDWLQELRGKAYIIIIDPAYGSLIDSAG
ncbi:MAG: peptidylprolyl isomerase [Gammaproteobacteria bacterium WSBS_2016_MAG_OTU1]